MNAPAQSVSSIHNPAAATGAVWLGSPVYGYRGSPADIHHYLPEFERQPFRLASNGGASGANEALDAIVRLPMRTQQQEIPIGVVSKGYRLVHHQEVLNAALRAVDSARIDLDEVTAELRITQLGERMELGLRLPESYRFDPGDDRAMDLRLILINSVDGSTRFMAVLGWLRFVCTNGLIVGTTQAQYRRAHIQGLEIEDVQDVLQHGLELAEVERDRYGDWVTAEISGDQVKRFINGPLKDEWGVKAATRAYHIANTGLDAVLVPPFEKCPPSEKAVKNGRHVPGAHGAARNLFDLSQVLSWLARDRRDVQEQLVWTREIPALMEALTGMLN